jgi:hypothetical protein
MNSRDDLTYGPDDLRRDLHRVAQVYANLGRDRLAIHGYWRAVYGLRRRWRRLRKRGIKIKQLARKAVGHSVPRTSGDDLLRLILDRTMNPAKQSPSMSLSKAKSKYARLLEFAFARGVETRALLKFIRSYGGLNLPRLSQARGVNVGV